MKIQNLLYRTYRKIFLADSYGVAVRSLGSQEPFIAKYGNNKEWYADPFLCSYDGEDYLFVELMDMRHVYGQIAVAPIKNGCIGDFQIVISEPFHMSFPNVFLWGNKWYMLPEVCMTKSLRLYECIDFPYRWKLKKILLSDVELVDHALCPKENGFYIISYDIKSRITRFNRIFDLNMRDFTVKEIFPGGDWCKERPAGNFFKNGDNIYHYVQDCNEVYGHHMHLWQINSISDTFFQESEIAEVFINDWKISPNNNKLSRTHTYNRNDKYEVIDFNFSKFYIDRPITNIYRNIINADRKHK